MKQMVGQILTKLERKLLPSLALYVESLQTKLRTYKHQELKKQLKSCGRGVRFRREVSIEHPQNVVLGNKIYIGPNVLLDGRGGITVGDFTTLGCNVMILSANHDYLSNALPYEHNVYIHKPVSIGRNVWIGANALIVPGVEIGDGAIIAAGCVVTSNVEPLAIVGSQPMRTLKYRDPNHYQQLAAQQTNSAA